MFVTRSYKIALFPNLAKLDTARYLINRFTLYSNYCVGRLFFNGNKNFSTKNLGKLFNQAQHKARGIVKAQNESAKVTNNKKNVPILKRIGVPVKFELSKTKNFDYWVKVSNQWGKKKTILIPGKSHKALNKALKQNWKLTSFGELKLVNEKLFLIVFVQKEVQKAFPIEKTLGCDVGINRSVSCSDEYQGTSLNVVISRYKSSQGERYRQRAKFGQKQVLIKNRKYFKEKTFVKQILDREAKIIVARCKDSGSSLAVESRKVIANLRSGSISLWARNHFANRCEILCKENEVFFVEVHPYQSSQTCSLCGKIDMESRDGTQFKCTSCGMKLNADINAALILSYRGRQVITEKILPKWR